MVFIAQTLRLAIRLGSAALLARILTPATYGLFGMAASVFGLLNMARDLGIITALQQPGITSQRFNAFCRVGLIGGLALAALGAALAIPTGRFYADDETVPWVVAAMCSAFIFSGVAAPALGLLYREQRAGQIAMIEVIAMAVGAVVAVTAANLGAGVWSLVLMGVLTDGVVCLLAWRACPWHPGSDTSGTSWSSLATFGASLTGHNIANYCTRTLDQITLGYTGGTGALGLYGRGAQIAALPAQYGIIPFNSYMVAGLRSSGGSSAGYTEFFRRGLNGLLHISFAAAAVCVAVPELLVRGLFGPQWLEASPVVRWLGIALAVQPLSSAPYWLLGGQGEGRRLLHWSICGVVFMGAGCAFAARLGLEAVAITAALAALLQAALAPVFCTGRTPVRVRDWYEPMFAPAMLHGGLAVLLFLVTRLVQTEQPEIVRGAVLLVAGLTYYGTAVFFSSRVRAELRTHVFLNR